MRDGNKSRAAHGRLFVEPEAGSARTDNAATAYIDGASRGNPGPAAYAVILKGPDGKVALESGKYFGRATNNVAEYHGLIHALDAAVERGMTRLRVRSDSELLVRQMEGRYKVKSGDLKPLYERAQKLARGFEWFGIEHVPREENREADRLANEALDRSEKRPTINFAGGEARKPKFETRRVRARYARGVLTPAEPLDLPEDAEVEITISGTTRDR